MSPKVTGDEYFCEGQDKFSKDWPTSKTEHCCSLTDVKSFVTSMLTLKVKAKKGRDVSPKVMNDITARTHVTLDDVRQHSVGNHPVDHSGGQDRWEAPCPDENDGDGHEGWGPQGTDNVDVARGQVQDPEEDVEALGKEGALLAEQHLIWPLQCSKIHGKQ